MINTQTKPAVNAWLILSILTIVAQLFNDVIEYAIACFILGFFIVELQFISKGKSVERNGYTITFNVWSYIWRTIAALFASTVLIITLAMIFHPDQFIHHRLLTIVAILINNVLLLWLLYRNRAS